MGGRGWWRQCRRSRLREGYGTSEVGAMMDDIIPRSKTRRYKDKSIVYWIERFLDDFDCTVLEAIFDWRWKFGLHIFDARLLGPYENRGGFGLHFGP
jgi:hypothetical protein